MPDVLYPLAARVAKRITLSTARAAFGFDNQTNIGMIFYTALQSAPCLLEDRPVLIPLGADQDPHFRLTRDVAPLLGHAQAVPHTQCDGAGAAGARFKNVGHRSQTRPFIRPMITPRVIRTKINRYAFSGGQSRHRDAHRRLGGDTYGRRVIPVS